MSCSIVCQVLKYVVVIQMCITYSFAEELTEAVNTDSSYLSVLAVGPTEGVKYRGEKLISREVGEEPPNAILLKNKKDINPVSFKVGNNKLLPFKRISSGEPFQVKRKIFPNLSNTETIGKVNAFLEKSLYLMILRPTGQNVKIWEDKPLTELINLNNSHNSIFINYSKNSLFCSIGTMKIELESSKKIHVKIPIKLKGYHDFEALLSSQKNIIVAKNAVSVSQNSYQIFIFYDANPTTNRGKEIGFIHSSLRLPKD